MTWTLSTAALLLGGVLVALHLPPLLFPAASRKLALGIPRGDWIAWGLTAIALTWTALIVLNAPLGRFDGWKPALYVVAPLAFIFIVLFLDELLAPRALGGLMLLAANPILNVARWHPSGLRLVVTTLVYLGVLLGMVLVLSPYRLRQLLDFWMRDPIRCRVGAALGVFTGGALILLAVTVYA